MKKLLIRAAVVVVSVFLLNLLKASPAYADTSHCGTISADETWSSAGNVHVVTCNVTVASGVTLTVTEGAIVKFNSGTALLIQGSLRVLGVEGNPVYFTSYRDDTIGGDTNGDGASTGARNDWSQIEFQDSSIDASSLIDHAVILHAGCCVYGGAIALVSASPTIRNASISNSQHGLYVSNSTPVLACSDIYDNGDYGLYNATTSVMVNAENQWWGSASGPYHSTTNPTGTGDRVTSGVDYTPWRTSPCRVSQYTTFLPLIRR